MNNIYRIKKLMERVNNRLREDGEEIPMEDINSEAPVEAQSTDTSDDSTQEQQIVLGYFVKKEFESFGSKKFSVYKTYLLTAGGNEMEEQISPSFDSKDKLLLWLESNRYQISYILDYTKDSTPSKESLEELTERRYRGRVYESKRNARRIKESSFKEEPSIKVGDIIVADFGYTQILPHFFEVVKEPSGEWGGRNNDTKNFKVVELGSKVSSSDPYGQAGTKVPTEEKGEIVRASLKKWKSYNDYTIYIQRHIGKIWDGKPVEFDTYD